MLHCIVHWELVRVEKLMLGIDQTRGVDAGNRSEQRSWCWELVRLEKLVLGIDQSREVDAGNWSE